MKIRHCIDYTRGFETLHNFERVRPSLHGTHVALSMVAVFVGDADIVVGTCGFRHALLESNLYRFSDYNFTSISSKMKHSVSGYLIGYLR